MCDLHIQTSIPRSNIFIFENTWLEFPGFLDLVKFVWTQSIHYSDATKRITAKFKTLRKELKKWSVSISSIQSVMADLNGLISLIDAIENFRDLFAMERGLRVAMKYHLASLLN
jgi:hypothetical protein